MSEKTHTGISKVKRYGWKIEDEPGQLMYLDKLTLRIHQSYQRDAILSKILEFSSEWSWVGAGVITVGYRDGTYWVIDGQHRVEAAKRRDDIRALPCIVFNTQDIKQEARAFLIKNGRRKPVTALGKYKAMIVSGDKTAGFVSGVFEEIGIKVKKTPTKPGEIKSISWAIKKAKDDPEHFITVINMANKLSNDIPISIRLLEGLWYINKNTEEGLKNKRLIDRIEKIGARKLIEAAAKAGSYFGKGGEKTYAIGMMDEINKGLRNKFLMNGAG